ncbi:MAG: dienelactone hydrolase family protein [Alphaproteobacteria bacterium]
MPHRAVSIPMPHGASMGGYLTLPPAGAGKGSGVVVLQEIFGINRFVRDVCDDLAQMGYVALAPDLFWRMEAGVDLDYSEPERAKAFAFWKKFDPVHGIADTGAAMKYLAGLPECNGKVGLVGFCLGGKLVVKAGADFGAEAIVSIYGVGLDADVDIIRNLRCPTAFLIGSKDAHIPAETVAAVKQATSGKANLSTHVYAGAQHGFYNHWRSEVHDPTAQRSAREQVAKTLSAGLN